MFGGWTIREARNDHATVGSVDFVVQGVWQSVFDTVEAIAKDVGFSLAMGMHGDHGVLGLPQAYELRVSCWLIQCFSIVIPEREV